MWPPANTRATRTAPMPSGASAEWVETAKQIVITRKKVPMNSIVYLRIGQQLQQASGAESGNVFVSDEDGGHHADALRLQLIEQRGLLGGVLLDVGDALIG